MVLIFAKSYCPYCKKAIALAKERYGEESVKIVEVSDSEVNKKWRAFMDKYGFGHHRTVPAVFAGSQFVGGSDDFAQFVAGV
jgi:glutaredoxin 3